MQFRESARREPCLGTKSEILADGFGISLGELVPPFMNFPLNGNAALILVAG